MPRGLATTLFNVRLTDTQRSQLHDAATAKGLSLSDYARRVLAEAAERDLANGSKPGKANRGGAAHTAGRTTKRPAATTVVPARTTRSEQAPSASSGITPDPDFMKPKRRKSARAKDIDGVPIPPTKTGKILTNGDIDALAAEAEAGYEVAKLKPKSPRKPRPNELARKAAGVPRSIRPAEAAKRALRTAETDPADCTHPPGRRLAGVCMQCGTRGLAMR